VALPAEECDGKRSQTENQNRNDALAAGWRGASKEGGMPVSDDHANFKRLRRLGSDPDQNDRGCKGHEGRHGVHHDAQRTMIDITGDRMRIRYMD
jgi:hypothetical protein